MQRGQVDIGRDVGQIVIAAQRRSGSRPAHVGQRHRAQVDGVAAVHDAGDGPTRDRLSLGCQRVGAGNRHVTAGECDNHSVIDLTKVDIVPDVVRDLQRRAAQHAIVVVVKAVDHDCAASELL